MQVANSTGRSTEYRISTGGQVVERSLEPYSYTSHEVESEGTVTVEFHPCGQEEGQGGLCVQTVDPRDEVVLLESGSGEYQVRVLSPEGSEETADAPMEATMATMEKVIEALLPPLPVPSSAAVLQARRNAEARASLIREFGALTSAEVAERAGSRASNRAALANRWRQEGRIFHVTYQGATLYPAFQFDGEGQPRPVVAGILQILASRSTEWQLALWFLSANGWLGGRRPVDLLDTDPAAVREAAVREAEDLVF